MPSEQESGSSRLNEILAEYLQRVEAGEPVDREALLQQHPELADELREFLAEDSQWKRVAHADDSEVSPTMDILSRDLSEAEFAPTFDSAAASESPRVETQRVGYFGDYELLEEIARGGMGVVYKARQVNLDRTVALKMILSGQLASDDDVRRFYREAESAAKLEHVGIVPIFEVGQHEGQHFFSMAFVDGPSLADLLADGPLPPREAADLVRQIAEAVHFAHQRGVIHRDLKPANVLLKNSGESRDKSQEPEGAYAESSRPSTLGSQPCVTDFGLAKSVDADAELTNTGQILGTPAYMPPEQASGIGEQVGPLADVYSLGAILYCTLTGRPPFQAANAVETLAQVLKREPVSPRQLNPEIPRDLDTVCLKCLQKERQKRYESASALAEELERWLGGRPITARPVSHVERAGKWVRRHPLVSSLTAALTIALLTGAVVSSVFAVRAQRAAVAERQARADAEEKRQRAEASERLATASEQKAKEKERHAIAERDRTQRHLYAVHMNQAQRQWEDGALAYVREAIDSYRPQADSNLPPDLRGWEWNHQWRRAHPELRRFTKPDRRLAAMAISPDGTRVAATGGEGFQLVVWDAASGELLTYVPESEQRSQKHRGVVVAYSPDGRNIATGGYDRNTSARIWDAESGKMLFTLPETKGDPVPTSMDFSPNSERLAIANADGAIRVWDLAQKKIALTIEAHGRQASNVAFSPDGKRLLSSGQEHENLSKEGDNYLIRLWNAETGELERTIRHHESGKILEATLSPSGRLIASRGSGEEGNGSDAKIWSAETGELLHTLSDAHATILFTPDEQRLITRGLGHSLKTWDVQSGELISERPYWREAGLDKHLLDPWGWQLLYAAGDIELSALQSDPVERTFNAFERLRMKGVAFAPEVGLFSASLNGEVALYDPLLGVQLKQIQTDRPIGAIAYGHDGRLFATAPPMLNRDNKDESYEGPQEIHIWDVTRGSRHRTISAHRRIPLYPAVRHLVFFPNDSRLLSIGYDKHVYVFDATNGKQLNDFRILGTPTMFIQAAAVSSDGLRLALASSSQMSIYEIKSGKQLQSWETESRTQHLKFSPDGKILATEDALWDAATGRELVRLRGHTSTVWDIAFSPDGRRLATTGMDETCRLWDVETGQQVLSLRQPFIGLGAAFSSDGHWLAIGLVGHVDRPEDGTLKVLDGRPPTPQVQVEREALALVRFLIARPLSKADVLKFVKSAPVSDPVKKRAAELAGRLQTETDPQRYADAARAIALTPHLNEFQYQFALAQAKTAHQLSGDEPQYLVELGMAQYRAHQFSQALETLNGIPQPCSATVLAFLAMANHQLGSIEQAAQLLDEVRERATGDSQSALLIDEVETLIQTNR